jgi:ribonuclease HI
VITINRVIIYTDGSSRGNPGPGGYGVVLSYTDDRGNTHIKELSQGYQKTTNNRMELLAAIRGLEALNKPSTVNLYSDSKYLIDAFNKGWVSNWKKNAWRNANHKPVKNQDMWKALITLTSIHDVTFFWVRGHDGNPNNERCDELAVNAALSKDLLKDVPVKLMSSIG